MQKQLLLQRYINRCGKQFQWNLVQAVVQKGPLSHQQVLPSSFSIAQDLSGYFPDPFHVSSWPEIQPWDSGE